MLELIDTPKILDLARPFLAQLLERLENPLFWLQFAIVAAVFFLARWALAPLLRRMLDWLGAKSVRVPALGRPISALRKLLVPASQGEIALNRKPTQKHKDTI
ncbi:MAG: hypothetical protein G8D28_10650 [gamma proteobacterium symbiont of Phacoides pectinatus]